MHIIRTTKLSNMGLKHFITIIFLLTLLCYLSHSEARKLMGIDGSLSVGSKTELALSEKSQSVIAYEKMLSLHFVNIDRILQSVPSPGVGHKP